MSTPNIVAQFPELDPDNVEATSLHLSILLGVTAEDEAFDVLAETSRSPGPRRYDQPT